MSQFTIVRVKHSLLKWKPITHSFYSLLAKNPMVFRPNKLSLQFLVLLMKWFGEAVFLFDAQEVFN